MQTMAEQNEFAALCHKLKEYFSNNTNINTEEVKRIMEKYKTNWKDWEMYAIFNENQRKNTNV
ncbi:hypothetical protein KUTeg_001290 [Tegillarca granosa]|uniref:Cysteine dioxygenase n=1 Tax=Tegillarca granosa TaxID=220873 RepID=A0ABQ9FZM0_TEGGR|nr:hypothetical protein KUTeg_001290 [Tegillarca granosa]